MLKTFQGGVHPATSKKTTIDRAIKKGPLPNSVIIPLLQHTGAPCQPLVAVGEQVKTGQLIAASDKFISSPIHSSVTGTVAKIDEFPHPVLGAYKAITIENIQADVLDPSIKARDGIDTIPAGKIRDIIKGAGIVGLGGAAFPTHVKLSPPRGKEIDSIILNGAECEPFLTCDHRLMLEKADGIIKGLEVIVNLTNADSAYIGIESNKIGAAFTFEKILRDRKIKNVKIVLLKTKYPQGAEKSLIKSILNREVPPKGLPFDVGCIVVNVGTALAIYEAISLGKPLYERVVTITGCVNEPSNLIVRIGTPIKDLVEACGGFKKDPVKMIFGGPMMGIAQCSLDIPVIKGTSGILFLSEEEIEEPAEVSCIRCAKCVDVCPINLIPTDISRLVKNGNYNDTIEYNIDDCMECGACSYECPSKIPLLQWIRLGKEKILRLRRRA